MINSTWRTRCATCLTAYLGLQCIYTMPIPQLYRAHALLLCSPPSVGGEIELNMVS